MKYLILTFLFLNFAQAKDIFYKVQDGKITYATYDKKLCPGCVKASTNEPYVVEVSDFVDEMVDDLKKPTFAAKSNVLECVASEGKTKKQDCKAKRKEHVCDFENGFYVEIGEGWSEVYCTKRVGYKKKKSGHKLPVPNASKKAAHDAKMAAKAADKTKLKNLKTALKSAGELSNQDIKFLLKYLLQNK